MLSTSWPLNAWLIRVGIKETQGSRLANSVIEDLFDRIGQPPRADPRRYPDIPSGEPDNVSTSPAQVSCASPT
jgi:hypothetical protein